MTSGAPHGETARRPILDTKPDLCETDFYTWTERQAALLRAGDFGRLDLANVIEEIESSGRSQRAALESAYRLVAMHLLKMMFQPERTSRSWRATITRERLAAGRVLRDNPGLKPHRAELFANAYQDARKEAAAETGQPESSFPEGPPFDLDALVNQDFGRRRDTPSLTRPPAAPRRSGRSYPPPAPSCAARPR